jgi:hypothetical protein
VRAWRGVVKIKESWLARQDCRTRAGFQKLVVGRYNGKSNAYNQLKDLYANVSKEPHNDVWENASQIHLYTNVSKELFVLVSMSRMDKEE